MHALHNAFFWSQDFDRCIEHFESLVTKESNMRKRTGFRKLGLDATHRFAMFRNMVTSLIKHERIMTTVARGKEMRIFADRMITHAKKGDLHHRRIAGAFVREKPALVKLFEILGPRYQ